MRLDDSGGPDATPGYALAGPRVYNEAAFRQLLAADRARAERLRRCLLLILVSFHYERLPLTALPKAVVTSVFFALVGSVRDVDIVGWLREGRVAAALLIQGKTPPDSSADAVIADRVRCAIEKRIPRKFAGVIRVRVRRLGLSLLN
jgi:hypothetical protein